MLANRIRYYNHGNRYGLQESHILAHKNGLKDILKKNKELGKQFEDSDIKDALIEDYCGANVLMYYAAHGNLDDLEYLITYYTSVDVKKLRDHDNNTIWHYFTAFADIQSIQLMLERWPESYKYSIRREGDNIWTFFMQGHTYKEIIHSKDVFPEFKECIGIVIPKEGDEDTDDDNDSIYFGAAYWCDYFRTHDFDSFIEAYEGYCPYMSCIKDGRYHKNSIIHVLAESCVGDNAFEELQKLLARFYDARTVVNNYDQPIWFNYAYGCQTFEALQKVIDFVPEILYIHDTEGRTIWYYFTKGSSVKEIKKAVNKYHQISEYKTDNITALFYYFAVRRTYIEIVEFIETFPDILDEKDSDGSIFVEIVKYIAPNDLIKLVEKYSEYFLCDLDVVNDGSDIYNIWDSFFRNNYIDDIWTVADKYPFIKSLRLNDKDNMLYSRSQSILRDSFKDLEELIETWPKWAEFTNDLGENIMHLFASQCKKFEELELAIEKFGPEISNAVNIHGSSIWHYFTRPIFPEIEKAFKKYPHIKDLRNNNGDTIWTLYASDIKMRWSDPTICKYKNFIAGIRKYPEIAKYKNNEGLGVWYYINFFESEEVIELQKEFKFSRNEVVEGLRPFLVPDGLLTNNMSELIGEKEIFIDYNVIQNFTPSIICPVSHEIMADPVITEYGNTYDRYYIEKWLTENDTDPLSGTLISKTVYPNVYVRNKVKEYLESL